MCVVAALSMIKIQPSPSRMLVKLYPSRCVCLCVCVCVWYTDSAKALANVGDIVPEQVCVCVCVYVNIYIGDLVLGQVCICVCMC